MNALAFDTLRLSRILRDKGHPNTLGLGEAEALADAFGEASHGDLATKADLAAVRTEIAETKTDLLKWIIATAGFQTIVILARSPPAR
jgi:hypothetical protein